MGKSLLCSPPELLYYGGKKKGLMILTVLMGFLASCQYLQVPCPEEALVDGYFSNMP